MEETKAPKVKIEATAELPEEEPQAEAVAEPLVGEDVEEEAPSEEVAAEDDEAVAADAEPEGGADDVAGDGASDGDPDAAPVEAPVAPAPVASVPAATRGFSAWLTVNFPGHEHTALGAFTGLVLALLVFAIGVWRVVFIAAMVTGGAVIGSFFDGESGVRRVIRRLLGGNKG